MRTLRGLRPSHSPAGFTLIEMLVSVSIFLVVLYGVYIIYDTGEANYVSSSRKWDVQSQARLALERMAREIRMAAYKSPTNVNDPIVIGTNDTISIHADVGDGKGLEYVTYGLRNCDDTVTQTLYRNASTGNIGTAPLATFCGGDPFIDGVTSLTFTYYEQSALSIPAPPLPSTYQLDTVNYVTGTNTPDIATMTYRNKVRQVKIAMTVQQTVGAKTIPYTITTDVTLRNLAK
jgi:prepilin-type N-terminal cleavage/methylation domain-containing protein